VLWCDCVDTCRLFELVIAFNKYYAFLMIAFNKYYAFLMIAFNKYYAFLMIAYSQMIETALLKCCFTG